jgi:formylglycine-generating enzyme
MNITHSFICALFLAGCSQAGDADVSDKQRSANACPARIDGEVRLPGGSFAMGADPLQPEEGPQKTISVGAFWIDRTEVTNAEFAEFVNATGYVTLAERPLDPKKYPDIPDAQRQPSSVVFDSRKGWRVMTGANWKQPFGPGSSIEGLDRHPVVQVGFDDALAYARWRGRDLPTEAEWEYAARGGIDGARYSWGDEKEPGGKPLANYWQGAFPQYDAGKDGYKEQSAPAGCFPANGLGLYDMAGNVWEWTSNWYAPNISSAPAGPPQSAAFDPNEPRISKRVIKGGSYLCAENYCFRYRPAARQAGPPDTGSSHIGFRTVRRTE